MRTILSFILVGALSLSLLAGCGDDSSGDGVSVVATTPQAADFAREVGGERVEVTQVLSPNADPHEYEPQPSDAEALADAELVIRSGGDLDEWLDQLIESSGTDAPVLTLMDSVETRAREGGEEDPHWWQDPRNAILAVGAIGDELAAVDPEGGEAYERAADRYTRELEALDRVVAACIEAVPEERRKIVTSHDSLGYFADRYGIEVIGASIPSLSTQAQPSAGETADLIELIRSAGVDTIFPEAGVSAELEESIAEQADATVGGELWADTLAPDGEASTYIGATIANTRELIAGFAGDVQVGCAFSAGS